MTAVAAIALVRGAALAHGSVLVQGAVLAKGGGPTTSDITPGVLGFLVVAGMGICLFFLLRSMNKQFRKIPPPEQADGARPGTRPQGRPARPAGGDRPGSGPAPDARPAGPASHGGGSGRQ